MLVRNQDHDHVGPLRRLTDVHHLESGRLGLVRRLAARLKTDDDIVTSLALPVIAVIPAMTNGTERAQQKRRTRFMVFAASTASVLLAVLAVAWKYRIIQDWVR
jgi:hypothetical protein